MSSTAIFAQFPMGDTSLTYRKDSIQLQDSLRKYKLAQIDTSFLDVRTLFDHPSFEKGLVSQDMQIQTPQINSKFSWLLIILLLCVIIVTFVKLYYQNYYTVLFNYLFSFNAHTTARDLGALNNLGTFLLNIVYVVVSSMSLYFVTIYFYPTIANKISLFFTILLVFAAHYLLKVFVLFFIEKVLYPKSNIGLYLKGISRTNQSIALLLLFILVIYLTGAKNYNQIIVFLLIFVLCIGQLVKYLKGSLSNIQQISIYFFHFIIYICTLEIAPILILYKLFIRHF